VIQAPVPADSIRRVLGEVFRSPPYQWREESDPAVLVRRWWRELTDWLDRLAGQHPTLFKLLVWGLVATLAAIAIHAIWVLIRTTRARAPASGGLPVVGTAEIRNSAWYAREAERLLAEGRYAAAIQADFLRLAIELDARDVLRFHPSRTPREYLGDLPGDDPRRAALADLIGDLYRYAFAGTRCGPAEFASWRSRASLDRYAPAA
jgi:hypothetical protein